MTYIGRFMMEIITSCNWGIKIMWAEDWKKGLDLDRLHKKHIHRGSGLTMAHIAAMFGEAVLGQPGNNYLYVAENYNICTWICRDFRAILDHEGISTTPNGEYRRDELYVEVTRLFVKGWQGTRTFDFHPISQIGGRAIGRQWDRIFLDVSAPMRIRFQEEIKILATRDKGCCGGDYVYY